MSWQLRQLLPDSFAGTYTSYDDDDEEYYQYGDEDDIDEYDDEQQGEEAEEPVLDHDTNCADASTGTKDIAGSTTAAAGQQKVKKKFDHSAVGFEKSQRKTNNTPATASCDSDTSTSSDDDGDDEFVYGAPTSSRQVKPRLSRRQRKKMNQAKFSNEKPTVRAINTKTTITTTITTKSHLQGVVEALPNCLKHRPYERFFAALLRSSVQNFIASSSSHYTSNYDTILHVDKNDAITGNKKKRQRPEPAQKQQPQHSLWTDICRRVNLQPPLECLKAKYPTEREHFAVRAALVLEESRCAIADGLVQRWGGSPTTMGKPKNNHNNNHTNNYKNTQIPKRNSATMKVQLEKLSEWDPKTQIMHLTFRLVGTGKFTKDQLFALQPGTVVDIFSSNNNNNAVMMDQNVLLGCIAYGSREEIERERLFTVMIFSRPPSAFLSSEADNMTSHPQQQFQVTPVAGLISQLRQFEACTNSKSINHQFFLHALLGHWPKHIRFSTGSDDDESANVTAVAASVTDTTTSGESSNTSSDSEDDTTLVAPPLNPTQEKAAKQFLQSVSGTITLVQGPPGTGKSTLLVSTICRYLLAPDIMNVLEEDEEESNTTKTKPRRLLVCAPTNKAVTVVASRFLQVLGQKNTQYNIVMVGDADKLLDPEEEGSFHNQQHQQDDSSFSHLRSIFVYTWISELIRQYKKLRQMVAIIQQKDELVPSAEDAKNEVSDLALRLHQRLVRGLPFSTHGKIGKLAKKVWHSVLYHSPTEVDQLIDDLIDELSKLPKEGVHQELLSYANVIFCTLATAGSNLFKRIPKVDDLIIDEASAATEPELYIPFHLKPRRLLVVGDPNQLPATVMSQRAVALGFDKSLHERLMHDCGCSYIMLDVQYRMNPGISQFPSERFYEAKITNGPNVSAKNYQTNVPLLCGKPYYFLQVDGKEEQAVCGSYRNRAEAHRVADLLQSLRSTAAQASSNKDNNHWHGKEKVRVITFYSAQVVLLRQILRQRGLGLSQVLVATVDSSQGCESDLVIVSFVRSNAKKTTAASSSSSLCRFVAGFLNDDRRMNVALTRAKHQLICVGNATAMGTMKATSTLYGLVSNAKARGCVVWNETMNASRGVEQTRTKQGSARSKRKVAS